MTKNHLSKESSPYLLQHKDNPVWWWPWSDEAFAAAKKEEKPVFLSIGYSSCHWCHVMEYESFEDSEVAELLNKSFISIKVDREELPDVDAIYMKAVQAMTRSGGWPMSVFLTPDKEPFYGGTYFPKAIFTGILEQLTKAWSVDRKRIGETASNLVNHLKEHYTVSSSSSAFDKAAFTLLSSDLLNDASSSFDELNGGFGRAPKFPSDALLRYLIRLYKRDNNEDTLNIITTSLNGMMRGGFYDHLGGGFHRYAVDARWSVPHFEKMLYTNATLAELYLEAFQLTEDNSYLKVSLETLRYLADEMTFEGAFLSAEDADSEGKEGTFYAWSMSELKSLLTNAELDALSSVYQLSETGNFEDNYNVLELYPDRNWSDKEDPLIVNAEAKLKAARDKRERPFKDDKVLTAWNALTISAFALAYRVTGEAKYLTQATKGTEFIFDRLVTKDELLRSFCKDTASISATLDDYAYLVKALLDLYEASFNRYWLTKATHIQSLQDKVLWNEELAVYDYSTQELLFKASTFHDEARPNSQSVSADNLSRLFLLVKKEEYKVKAERLLAVILDQVRSYPSACATAFLALDRYHAGLKKVEIKSATSTDEALVKYLRNLNLSQVTISSHEEELSLSGNQGSPSGLSVSYCDDKGCTPPTSNLAELQALVKR